ALALSIGICASAETPTPTTGTTKATPASRKTVRRRPGTAVASRSAASRNTVAAKAVARRAAPVRVTTASLRTTAPAARITRTVAPAPIIRGGPWLEPTYADSTQGDRVDGEDLDVRRAAVEALGDYNGSVVVADPATGRILTMVNQKAALSSGFQPCST